MASGTAAFALVHSALASRRAKSLAARLLGPRGRNALYRALYNGQAVLGFAALLVLVARQPSRTLWRVRRPWSLLMRAGQAAGLAYAYAAAREVGLARITGLSGLAALLRGVPVSPEPEAQGPAQADERAMKVAGPFRYHRHPLNFAPLPVLWLFPRMTTRLAALSAASTLYLWAGSRHEEARLRAAYGEPYARYQESGVPFYLPGHPVG